MVPHIFTFPEEIIRIFLFRATSLLSSYPGTLSSERTTSDRRGPFSPSRHCGSPPVILLHPSGGRQDTWIERLSRAAIAVTS
mmetsp:Transcript_13242/g.28968  ORF Transcript_13242/g.28968 Transcript_13242/m.28968 type:complete len:82 (+) Transcript_13242:293-538(+)